MWQSRDVVFLVSRRTVSLPCGCVSGRQIRLVEGRDRPIDRLAKNVLLFGQQDEGEVDVSERTCFEIAFVVLSA